MSEPATTTPESAPPKRRRWLKITAAIVVLLILVLATAPSWTASIVRGAVVSAANEQLDGTLAIESLSWSWGGSLRLEGLRLLDAAGQPALSVATVEASVDVLPALSGDIRATVNVDGVQADVRRRPDGRINLQAIGDKPGKTPKSSPQSDELPQVALKLAVTEANVHVHGEDGRGDTQLKHVRVGFDLAALDQPASFDVAATLVGPAGPAGGIKLNGDVLLAPGGVLSPDSPKVRLDYTLEALRVEGLAPAAALFAPAPAAAGRVAGTGHWEWEGGLKLQGQTALTLDGLRIEGAGPDGQALVLPDTRLTAQAQLEASGEGRQTLGLICGPLLELHWDGAVAGLRSTSPTLDGTLTLHGDLAGLFELARAPLSLQPGVGVSGTLALESKLRASLSPQGAESVSVDGQMSLKDAAARDAQGQPIDLGGLGALQLALKLSAQPVAGRAALEAFEVHAGPVNLSARGRLAGLPQGDAAFDPAQLSIEGGEFNADAELAPLLAAVAPLVDLRGLTARGTLTAKGTANGSAGAVTGQANFDIHDLALHGPDGLDVSLPSVSLDASASADAEAVRVQSFAARWEPLRAMAHEVPGGALTGSASFKAREGALDIPQWTLSGPLVSGQGFLRASGFAQPAAGASTTSAPAALRVETELQLSGQVEAARAWMVALMPELKPAKGEGQWDLKLAATVNGDHITAQPALTLRGVALHGYVMGGRELPLNQADVDFSARLDVDRAGAGSLRADDVLLRAPGIELKASGTAAGFTPDPKAATGAFECAWSMQPAVVTTRLGALLGGLSLAGEPLSGSLRGKLEPAGLTASGDLEGAELAVTLPADPVAAKPARTLVQRDLAAAFDLTASPWPAVDTLDIRKAEFGSGTARASLAGRVEHVSTPAASSADVRFHFDTELERLLADLGPALTLPDWKARGAMQVEGALKGDAGRLALTTDGTITNLHMVVPVPASAATGPGASASSSTGATAAAPLPIVIDEPSLGFGLAADVLVEPQDITLGRASISSSFLQGQMSGKVLAAGSGTPRLAPLDGQFTYIPDTLGALLSPWLPVQWTGSQPQPVHFHVEGPLADVDPVALLGGLAADATVGLGQISAPGLTARGQMSVANHDGRTHLTGTLTANSGTLDLDADLDLRAAARPQPAGAPGAAAATAAAQAASSQFKLKLSGLQVTQELAELLARMHPLFAGSAGSQLATVSGSLSADVAATWAGPLPQGEPPGGWVSAASRSLSATGHLQADALRFASSALLGDMLSAFNLPGQSEMSLAPIDFRIDQGRLSYAQPWVLKLAGMDTSFTGSVGLDLSLDMQWNVPVTDKLIEKHGFLSSLAGQSISVPITGTATAPVLEWTGALKDLAERAAKSELEKRLKDKLGGLPSIPGITAPPAGGAGGTTAPASSPEDLLARADKLWDEGKKTEAQPLYQELIDKHKLTLVYALNKKRIKDRAEGK